MSRSASLINTEGSRPRGAAARRARLIVLGAFLVGLACHATPVEAVPKWWYSAVKEYDYGERMHGGVYAGSNILYIAGQRGFPSGNPRYFSAAFKVDISDGTTTRVYRTTGSGGATEFLNVCLDSSGNVYWTGKSGWVTGNPGIIDDAVVWSTDGSLNHRWERVVQDTSSYEHLNACTTDSTYVYAVGDASAATVQGQASLGGYDVMLVKIQLSDGTLNTVKRYGSAANDHAASSILWTDSGKTHFFIGGSENGDAKVWRIQASDLSVANSFVPPGTSASTEYSGNFPMAIDYARGEVFITGQTNNILPGATTNAVDAVTPDSASNNLFIMIVDTSLTTVIDTIQIGGAGAENIGSDLVISADGKAISFCGKTGSDIDQGLGFSFTGSAVNYLATLERSTKRVIGALPYGTDGAQLFCGAMHHEGSTNQLIVGSSGTQQMPTGVGFSGPTNGPYSSTLGATNSIFSVEACAPGHFMNAATWDCDSCSVGHYMPVHLGFSYCIVAPAGSFVDTTGASEATRCPAGSYQPSTGQSSCLPCPIGEGQPLTGQTACVQCDKGFYASTTGLAACEVCPTDTYNDVTGQSSCKTCPNSAKTQTTASDELDDCMCVQGYYGDPLGKAGSARPCRECPRNTECAAHSQYPSSKKGYWLSSADPDKVYQCSPASACTGSSGCDTGYAGTACSDCSEDYYRSKGTCNECPWTAPFWVVLIVVALGCLVLSVAVVGATVGIFVMNKVFKSSKRLQLVCKHIGSVSIRLSKVVSSILKFSQLLSVGFSIPVEWPGSIAIFRNIFFLVNFININNIFPAECYFGASTSDNTAFFYVKAFSPVILIIVIAANAVLLWLTALMLSLFKVQHPAFKTLTSRVDDFKRFAMKVAVQLVQTTYVFVVASSVSTFVCYEKAAGEYYLVSDPSLQCFVTTSKWIQMIPAAIILYVTVGMGFPVFILVAMCLVRYLKKMDSPDVRIPMGSLYLPYDADFYWWEAFAVATRLLLTSCLVFSAVGMRDQLFIMSVVCLTMLLLHVRSMPYQQAHVDKAELNVLLTLFIVLMSSVLISGNNGSEDDLTDFSMVLIAIFIIVAVLYTLSYFVYSFIMYDVGVYAAIKNALLRRRNGKMLVDAATESDGMNDDAPEPKVMKAANTQDFHKQDRDKHDDESSRVGQESNPFGDAVDVPVPQVTKGRSVRRGEKGTGEARRARRSSADHRGRQPREPAQPVRMDSQEAVRANKLEDWYNENMKDAKKTPGGARIEDDFTHIGRANKNETKTGFL